MNKEMINAHMYMMFAFVILYKLEILDEEYSPVKYVWRFKLSRVTRLMGKLYYPGEYIFKITPKLTILITKVVHS